MHTAHELGILVLAALQGAQEGGVQQGNQGSNEGISEATALVVAAIAGAVLTTFGATVGGLLNNYLAGQREERRETREVERQKKQWEREDRLREEDQREQIVTVLQERRVLAYKAFAAATAIELGGSSATKMLAALDETFVDVRMCASMSVSSAAYQLYGAARSVVETSFGLQNQATQQQLLDDLFEKRKRFWSSVRTEAEDVMEED